MLPLSVTMDGPLKGQMRSPARADTVHTFIQFRFMLYFLK